MSQIIKNVSHLKKWVTVLETDHVKKNLVGLIKIGQI